MVKIDCSHSKLGDYRAFYDGYWPKGRVAIRASKPTFAKPWVLANDSFRTRGAMSTPGHEEPLETRK